MVSPEVHHLFHHPIADHSFSLDKHTLAVARDNTVDLFQKAGNKFILKDELKGHDKTVTGVDIALRSGRVVTCSQGVTIFCDKLISLGSNLCYLRGQTVMRTSGSAHQRGGNRLWSFSESIEQPPMCAGRRLNRNLPWAPAPA